MENNKQLPPEVQTYFLKQGKSIARVNNIISSNAFTHHLGRWWSMLLEFLLYVAFIGGIISLSGIAGDKAFICGLISLPFPFIALLLRLNRRRSILMHEAASEVQKMKEEFDVAVKELEL